MSLVGFYQWSFIFIKESLPYKVVCYPLLRLEVHLTLSFCCAGYRWVDYSYFCVQPNLGEHKKKKKMSKLDQPNLPSTLVWTKISLDKYSYCLPYLPIQNVWDSPEWSYAVIFSLSWYCMVLYSLVRSLMDYTALVLYCPLWFCIVVQCLGWSFLVVYLCVVHKKFWYFLFYYSL